MNESVSCLRIGFVGDIGLGPAHGDLYAKHGARFLHEEVQSLFAGADLIIGNLECSIPSIDAAGITPSDLYTSPQVLQCLKEQLNLHVCLANNHIADYGDQGVGSTLHYLKKAGIPYFGAGLDYAAAVEPHVVRIGDISVGLVCASDFRYSNATKNSAGSAPLDMGRLTRQIKELREVCEHVIVLLHADEEFQDYPAPYRIRLSRRLIDVGADAVIQHHPHVVQGVEIYKGRTIAYSLGNWVFKMGNYQSFFKQTRFGVFFVLELPTGGRGGVQRFNVTHTMIDEMYRPVLLDADGAAAQQVRFEEISTLVVNTRLVRNNWFKACKASIFKEAMNSYYILRKSGIRIFIGRLKHLLKESLFRRQLLGMLTLGNY